MKRHVISAALTWDGVRLPLRSLPLPAQKFLKTKVATFPTAKKSAALLAADEVAEIRICWVPQLRGGDSVLAESFSASAGKRMAYRPFKMTRLGDMLGVVYKP